LAKTGRGLCRRLGDHAQAVYGFRGADYRNLVRFEETFPDATVIVLEQNYRSTQAILDAANAVIANNAARRPKHLWTEQIVKRGWTSWEIPNVLHPTASAAWAAMVAVAALFYFAFFRSRSR